MQIFNYDKDGNFTGESIADLSPLEEDVYLIPAMATDIPPLSEKEGFKVLFNGSEWVYAEIVKIKPNQSNEYSVWDSYKWEWVEDSSLKLAYDIAQKVQEANAFLASTDWVEPLIIAHKLGLDGYVLSPDSNKLLIDAQRDEARAFVRANS